MISAKRHLLQVIIIVFGIIIHAAIAGKAGAQERKLSISFTKEILYTLASDNQGEKNKEMADRIIGLSPAIKKVSIIRSGSYFILSCVTTAEDIVNFQFDLSFDKMDIYKMAVASKDVTSLNQVMTKVKSRNAYIKAILYRYDERYSIIDLVLDIKRYISDIEEKKPKTPPPPKKVTPPSPAKKSVPVAKAVQKKPPQPPPSQVVKKPPPEPESLIVSQISQEILIDGNLEEDVWTKIAPFRIGALKKKETITVSAMAFHDDSNIYFAFSWPDTTKDDKHKPWTWDDARGDYIASSIIEDSLAVSFWDSQYPSCMTSGQEIQNDIWHWRSGRTNPSGFAEDGWMVVSSYKLPQANSYPSKRGGSVWIKIYQDEGELPYRSEILVLKKEDEMPRYLPHVPTRSMSDVIAKGSWKNGTWTVEMARKLSTGNKDDIAFSKRSRPYYFSIALFDAVEGKEHSTTDVQSLNLNGVVKTTK